jgi:hypothetical protein
VHDTTKGSPRIPFLRILATQNGTAMVFVLVLAVIGGIVMASIFMTSRVTIKKSGYRRGNVNLFNIAEAGKEDGYSMVKSGSTNPESGTRLEVVRNDDFSGGSYVVTCSTNTAKDTLWLTSQASYLGKTKVIEALYAMSISGAAGAAFGKGLCVGGDLEWKGSGSVVAGSAQIHCNGFFTMTGSSDITADVYACAGLKRGGSSNIFGNVWAATVSQTGSGSISGTVITGVIPTVSIPVLDLTPYYNHALANGQVYTPASTYHISGSSDHIVPGGIMWVEGNFKRSGSGDFIGCVIATGDINCSGSGDYLKVNEYPVAVSVNGKIDFSGSGHVHGLLFSQNGEFEKTGSGNVTGSIICKGDARKTGSWDFLTYEQSVPVPPGGGSGISLSMIGWREY